MILRRSPFNKHGRPHRRRPVGASSMKVKLILSILLAGLLCSTASAETNWVQRFLERYRTPQVSAGGVPSALPPASLGAMVQNGMISLTTEDIVRLLLENNRDVIVNRLSPISSFYTINSLI